MADPAWKTRVWREFRAGNLTRAFRDILLSLASFRGPGGHIFPSHATIAQRARCSPRHVRRALTHGRELGLVQWGERRRRVGWRSLRSSNAYWLTVPDSPVESTRAPIWPRRTGGQPALAEEQASKKEALRRMLAEAAAAPDLLALRRAQWAKPQCHRPAAGDKLGGWIQAQCPRKSASPYAAS